LEVEVVAGPEEGSAGVRGVEGVEDEGYGRWRGGAVLAGGNRGVIEIESNWSAMGDALTAGGPLSPFAVIRVDGVVGVERHGWIGGLVNGRAGIGR
jgi:hypothetical protein